MSDKNRNMNDINDQKTAEQQAFSEEIRRRLAEPGSGKPTLEEFKVMVYKDREKRRKKRNSLIACIVAAFIVGYLTYDDLLPEVGADKNPKETIQTEDGVIIEDGGWGSSEEEKNIIIIDEWEHVRNAKKTIPELVVPKYLPQGYQFKCLKIENVVENDIICKYIFTGDNQNILETEIFISHGETTTSIADTYEKIKCCKGELYVDRNEKTAIITINDGIVVNIWYDFTEEELIDFVEALE